VSLRDLAGTGLTPSSVSSVFFFSQACNNHRQAGTTKGNKEGCILVLTSDEEVSDHTGHRQRKPGGEEMEPHIDWKRVLIYGSFGAGALLFLTGRRPAGLVVAGIGVATLAASHPEKFQELWRRMPEYVEKGGKLVDMTAAVLERVGELRSSGYRSMR
jgi:hypothetical protein